MDTKIKIGLILIIYAALAVIPGVLGYIQYTLGQHESNVSCNSCHIDGSKKANMSFSNNINLVYDTGRNVERTRQGNENIP